MMVLRVITEDDQGHYIQLGDALWTEEMGSEVLDRGNGLGPCSTTAMSLTSGCEAASWSARTGARWRCVNISRLCGTSPRA